MTTALREMKNVTSACRELCDGYLTKPLEKAKLAELRGQLGLPKRAAA